MPKHDRECWLTVATCGLVGTALLVGWKLGQGAGWSDWALDAVQSGGVGAWVFAVLGTLMLWGSPPPTEWP